MTAKSVSIKGTGCKSGGCAPKADELTSRDLLLVGNTRLRMKRFILTGREKSAEGDNRASDEGPNGPRKGLMGGVSK